MAEEFTARFTRQLTWGTVRNAYLFKKEHIACGNACLNAQRQQKSCHHLLQVEVNLCFCYFRGSPLKRKIYNPLTLYCDTHWILSQRAAVHEAGMVTFTLCFFLEHWCRVKKGAKTKAPKMKNKGSFFGGCEKINK